MPDELEDLYQKLEAAVKKGNIKKWVEYALKIKEIEDKKNA